MSLNKILLIDDYREESSILEYKLKTSLKDVIIKHALDGQEARELLKTFKPTSILLDINIPGENGFGLFDSLKASGDLLGVPVYIYSGSECPQDTVKAQLRGAVKYIHKDASGEKIAQAMGIN